MKKHFLEKGAIRKRRRCSTDILLGAVVQNPHWQLPDRDQSTMGCD
jgi:hypothetical protein